MHKWNLRRRLVIAATGSLNKLPAAAMRMLSTVLTRAAVAVVLALVATACKDLPEGAKEMRVTGSWMRPEMLSYGWVTVHTKAYASAGDVAPGDIVVYRQPFGNHNILCAARAIGLPGDEVSLSDTYVFLNRRRLKRGDLEGNSNKDSKAASKTKSYMETIGEISYRVAYDAKLSALDRPEVEARVGPARVFVLGDSRDYRRPANSCVPRRNSTVEFGSIVGKLIAQRYR